MKLFDIIAGKVVIHNDALGIPFFRKLWENTQDKALATNYISYIVLKNKFDSPYVLSCPPDKIEAILKEQIFNDPNYILPDQVKDCEQKYIGLLDTLMLRLLKNARNKLNSISDYYEQSLKDYLDEKKIKDLLQG